MFDSTEMDLLRQSSYIILQMNHHDTTFHSPRTGHDWIIVSNYTGPDCYILHRHSRKYSFHRQRGRYRSLKEALDYIDRHEEWYITEHRQK